MSPRTNLQIKHALSPQHPGEIKQILSNKLNYDKQIHFDLQRHTASAECSPPANIRNSFATSKVTEIMAFQGMDSE